MRMAREMMFDTPLVRAVRMGCALGLAAFAWLLVLCPALAQTDTTVNAGDTVFVDVYRRPELSSSVQVDPNGNISIPYVGSVNVGGVTEKEASERVAASLITILKNPRVTVSHSTTRQVAGPRTSEMKTQVIALNNAKAEALCKSLQGMASSGGSIASDKNSNTLIITDTPGTIQNIMGAITQIDQMQSQVTQVRIETKMAEVEQGAMKNLGIRWFFKGNEVTGGYYPSRGELTGANQQADSMANEQVSGGGSSSNSGGVGRQYVDGPKFDRRLNVPVQIPTLGQMFVGVLKDNVDIGTLLDALVKDNKAQLLTTPQALAVNHTQAEIKMMDEFPYMESSQTFGGTAYSVRFMDLGIKLMVTPHVYKDVGGPYVQLELNPEVSFSTGMSNGVPIRSVRSYSGVGNVRNGQTLVIGGIVLNDERNVTQSVPGLGKIPLLGSLFKRKEKARSRNELMVFVTPTIYDAPESITWDRMINLTGTAKEDFGAVSKAVAQPIPAAESRTESRKE